MSFSERFSYETNDIIVPPAAELDRATFDPTTPHRTKLNANMRIHGFPVMYDSIIFSTEEWTYVTLTAVHGPLKQPIGFRDLRINNGHVSWGDGCFGFRFQRLPHELRHSLSEHIHGIPHHSLRLGKENPGGAHSFVVKQQFQGHGLGRALLFTGFELAHRAGALRHVIQKSYDGTIEERPESYYQQFTPTKPGNYIIFDLHQGATSARGSQFPEDTIHF